MADAETDLARKHAEAEAKLGVARRRRGAALLDGEKPDHAAVAEAEHAVEALAEAESEAARRRREREERDRDARREAFAHAVLVLEGRRLGAIARAEDAARDLVAALATCLDAANDMAKRYPPLERPVPLALTGDFAVRLSQRLAALLGTIPGHPARFGNVSWRASWRKADEDWFESEKEALAAEMETLRKRKS